MRTRFTTSRAHIISVLIIINFIFFSNFISPAHAQFENELDFYAGILLYAPDFSYDLSPLDEMAENDEVIIIDEFTDLVALGIEDGSTDISGDATFFGEPALLNDFEPEPGQEGDIEFVPGTYYVYPSHYNSEVGVVIYEVKNSLIYPEANHLEFENNTENPIGFEENSEGAWENISGLSVNLVIPAEYEEKQVQVTIKTLSLDYEIELNETLTWFMDELGYFDSGFSVYQANSNNESKVVSLTYEKENVELWLSSGMGGQTWDGTGMTFSGESKIQLVFYGTVIDDSVDFDVKKLLEYLQINPDKWDEVKPQPKSKTELVLSPTIDIVDEEFNWITAMYTELAWLAEQGIILGISNQKIKEIANSTIAGYDVFAMLKTPEGGFLRFEQGGASFGGPSSQFSEIVDKALGKLKGEPDKPDPEFIPLIILQIIGGIIVITAIGTFAYTRIKRRNILDNINRKNIFEYIRTNQGVHFKKLLRQLNFQPGAMAYHLNVLEKGEFIKSIQDGNLRRFYLYGTRSDFKIALTSIQLRILSIIDERPGISQSKISELLGKNRMLVNYHIKILDDADLISMEKEGRVSKVFTTGNAETYLS
jgi:predicted transcriptional regulator